MLTSSLHVLTCAYLRIKLMKKLIRNLNKEENSKSVIENLIVGQG